LREIKTGTMQLDAVASFGLNTPSRRQTQYPAAGSLDRSLIARSPQDNRRGRDVNSESGVNGFDDGSRAIPPWAGSWKEISSAEPDEV
jgi:hypothetical protein